MTIILALLMITALISNFSTVKSDPNTAINDLECSTQSYASNDPYGNNVIHVLADLTNVAPTKQGYDYYTQSPDPTSVAYGHATCTQALTNADCANCLVPARNVLYSECGVFLGGQVQLVDCTMRFENYPFV